MDRTERRCEDCKFSAEKYGGLVCMLYSDEELFWVDNAPWECGDFKERDDGE